MNRKNIFFIVVTGCLLMLHTTTYASQQGREMSPVLHLLLSGKLTGVFIDSRVQGLRYTTSSGVSGRTDDSGEFKYRKGDTIEFFIGSNSLGSVPAEQLISVIKLNDFSKLAMLLQALDTDHKPDNGIQLDAADDEALAKSLLPLQEVDPEDENFTANFKQITGKDFQINEYNSVEHSYSDIRIEALKKTSSTNLLYRYYIGDIDINDAFNKDKLEQSSRARVQLYFCQYLVQPYIELMGKKIWNESETTLENHELFEKTVEWTAKGVSAANIAAHATPGHILREIGKEIGIEGAIDVDTSDFFLPANGTVGTAVKQFLNRWLKLFYKCAGSISGDPGEVLTCSTEASKQIMGIINDIKAAYVLSQNNAELNAYTVVSRMLYEWYWGGGDVEYIADKFGMSKYSNSAFLTKIKEDVLAPGADCDDDLVNRLFADSLAKISAAEKKFFENTGLPKNLSNPGDILDISFLDPKLVGDKLEFCYKVDNRVNDTVYLFPTFKVTPTSLATTPASVEQTEELSLGPLGGFSHCAILAIDNYQQTQELEDYINLSLKVEYNIFTDIDSINEITTKNSIYHFNQNLLEFIQDAAALSVTTTTPIAAAPGDICPLGVIHQFPVTSPVQYSWRQVLQDQSWATVSITDPQAQQASFLVPDLPSGVTQKSLWFAVTVTSVDTGEEVEKVIRVVVQPDASAPLSPPTNLTAVRGNDSIAFSWDAVPDAESYTLYVTSQSGITPDNYSTFPYYAKVSGITAENYDFTGLEDGTTYYAIVTAERNFSESDPSNEVALSTQQSVETVVSATGRVWMDRNLGASRVATSSTDTQAYGDLYQWGRGTDGHEKRNSPITSTNSASDTPGHGSFILETHFPGDWRTPQNDNLWQGVSGTNNPCPAGFRLPTATELDTERQSWSTNDAAGAYASPLKLVVAGYRNFYYGTIGNAGIGGYYWSSTVDGGDSRHLDFSSGSANMGSGNRAVGVSVRCLKD